MWNYYVVAKELKNWTRGDWLEFKSQIHNFYQADSNAIFSIVFACLFYIIISKLNFYLSDKTRRKKLFKKRLSVDLAFWIPRTQCMQNKTGLEICRIALQRIVLLKVYKKPGPNRSGISDLKFRGQKKCPKTAQIWVVEIRKFQFLSKLSVQIKPTLRW